ncbi:MAG: hypothetical protein IKR41_11290 [Bacteroidales bacterium]|nr:hypothetical protein [Bacteroidales bacterium]
MKKVLLSLLFLVMFVGLGFAQRSYIKHNMQNANGIKGMVVGLDQWQLSAPTEVYTCVVFFDVNGNQLELNGEPFEIPCDNVFTLPQGNVYAEQFVPYNEISPYLQRQVEYGVGLYIYRSSNDDLLISASYMETFHLN